VPKPATKYFPEENYTELDLVSLSYVSDATEEFGILALMQLVDKASRRNKSLNVTGVLSFDNGRFGQIIEGKPKDVELLWEGQCVCVVEKKLRPPIPTLSSNYFCSSHCMMGYPSCKVASTYRSFLCT